MKSTVFFETKTKALKKCFCKKIFLCFCAFCFVFLSCPEIFANEQTPQYEQAQQYIEKAPLTLADFANAPLESIFTLLSEGFLGQVVDVLGAYLELLTFMLFGAIVCMMVTKPEWISLVEIIVISGSFVLVARPVLDFCDEVVEGVLQWQLFLQGFIPVFTGVVAVSGETISASLYSGFFLICISLLAVGMNSFLVPLVECYLALSVASAMWVGEELPTLAKTIGKLLKKAVWLAGTAFTVVFGIQRVFSASVDNVAINAAKTVSGAIPIVGQTVSDSAQTLLATAQVLKTGVGFAAFAIIAESFIPIYIKGVLHLFLLCFCSILAKLFSLARCGKLFDCLAVAVECVLAVLALFFFMVLMSTALMVIIGSNT